MCMCVCVCVCVYTRLGARQEAAAMDVHAVEHAAESGIVFGGDHEQVRLMQNRPIYDPYISKIDLCIRERELYK